MYTQIRESQQGNSARQVAEGAEEGKKQGKEQSDRDGAATYLGWFSDSPSE